MEIVKNIDRYCAKERITTKEFERKCNIANSLVHKWRLGLQTPSLRTINKIIGATGIPFEQWMRENGV